MAYPPNLEYLYENSGAGPKLRPAIVPSAALVVGDIRYWPFRAGSLPPLWYACTGDNYALTSDQGQALYGLPATFKSDWGIVVSGGTLINVPMAFSSDGLGCFIRAADGTTRQAGSFQTDGIRNITGFDACMHALCKVNSLSSVTTALDVAAGPRGAFYKAANYGTNGSFAATNWSYGDLAFIKFDASLEVPTASENRPFNVAMTLAIYLGV